MLNTDEPKNTSLVNEGTSQLQRIEVLLSSIQSLTLNMIVTHPELNGRFGFEVVPELFDGLIKEIIPFLTSEEEEQVLKFRSLVKRTLVYRPIIKKGQINKNEVIINQENLNSTKELFFTYELHIRKLLTKYEILNLKKSNEEKIR